MSTHNIVHAMLRCPRCLNTCAADIEGFFGFGNLDEYNVGDQVRWVPRKSPVHGGRPPNGSMDAEGYVVCPQCGYNFFVKILIRDDKISDVVIDRTRAGHGQ